MAVWYPFLLSISGSKVTSLESAPQLSSARVRMTPGTPAIGGYRPDKSAARVGEHTEELA